MEYFELIEKRHSVRSYKSDPVEKDKLDKILDAAGMAPTAKNLQDFKIIVISTKGKEAKLRKIYDRDFFVEAPYVLCVCSVTEKNWIRRDGKNFGDVDASIIMDHIILAATDQGLGTCWIGAFDAEAAKNELELDHTLEPIVFTPVGYERTPAYKKVRKPLTELVEYK